MEKEKRMIDMDVAIERARASDNIVGSSIWETCEVVEFLEDCPIVDAVEVVRCKDCRYCEPERHYCDHPMSTSVPIPRKSDGFCSYGERKYNG